MTDPCHISKQALKIALENREHIREYLYTIDKDLYTKLYVELYGNSVLKTVSDDAEDATTADLITLLKCHTEQLQQKLSYESYKRTEMESKYKEVKDELDKKRKRADDFQDSCLGMIKEMSRKKDAAIKQITDLKEQLFSLRSERDIAIRDHNIAKGDLDVEREKRRMLRSTYRVFNDSFGSSNGGMTEQVKDALQTMQTMLKN